MNAASWAVAATAVASFVTAMVGAVVSLGNRRDANARAVAEHDLATKNASRTELLDVIAAQRQFNLDATTRLAASESESKAARAEAAACHEAASLCHADNIQLRAEVATLTARVQALGGNP